MSTENEKIRVRAENYERMRRVLEQGLLAIKSVESPDEVDKARWSARDCMKELDGQFRRSFEK